MTTANPRLTDHPEEAAVRVPLELYMRGHAEDNSAHMRAAFMPTARIESVREGPLTSWDIDTYCARFKGQPAADEHGAGGDPARLRARYRDFKTTQNEAPARLIETHREDGWDWLG